MKLKQQKCLLNPVLNVGQCFINTYRAFRLVCGREFFMRNATLLYKLLLPIKIYVHSHAAYCISLQV